MAKLGMRVKYVRNGITLKGIVVANNGQHNKVYVTEGETSAPKWDVYPSDKIDEVSNQEILYEYDRCDLYAGFCTIRRWRRFSGSCLIVRDSMDGTYVCL